MSEAEVWAALADAARERSARFREEVERDAAELAAEIAADTPDTFPNDWTLPNDDQGDD